MILTLVENEGGGEYIKEKKPNPRFYRYGSVFKKPQSFFCLTASKTASKTEAASKTEYL